MFLVIIHIFSVDIGLIRFFSPGISFGNISSFQLFASFFQAYKWVVIVLFTVSSYYPFSAFEISTNDLHSFLILKIPFYFLLTFRFFFFLREVNYQLSISTLTIVCLDHCLILRFMFAFL